MRRTPPAWGILESAAHLVTCPWEIPDRFVVHCGDRHRRAIPGAGQAGPLDGITAVRCDPLPRLLRQQRRGHDPAGVPCVLERARAPSATGPRFREKEAVGGFR